MISHEIFEASADPADDSFQGWDETVDQCDNASAISLPFGPIPPPTDNTNGGDCSTTGYTSHGEYQDYGVTYTDFRRRSDELWPDGWRLYILASYVLSDGTVLYDAVWRPGDLGERQDYGVTYTQYRSDYDTLSPQGWRLYTLDSYVISDGTVRYNAVWRPGTHGEIQVSGWTYADFRSKYDEPWAEGWRLYVLNAYVLPGNKVRYDAVWRQGTIDRPL